MALGEHASVASFARFVLDLLAVAAPPAMLSDAIRAMEDEVQHARLCFAQARRFNGHPAGPGRLDLTAMSNVSGDETAVLLAAITEGCIGETISARVAAVAAESAADEAVRAALSRIADDEERHAELAWRFVRWMLETRPQLAPAARTRFLEHFVEVNSTTATADETPMPVGFGVLSRGERHNVQRATLLAMIAPRVQRLLDGSSEGVPCSSGTFSSVA
ncbi:MAG: hypothetical protein WDO56_11820 [Gammaproteobacteria bacterium]